MEKKFPVIDVVKGSLLGPLGYTKGLIKTASMMALSVLGVILYAMYNGITWDIVVGFADPAQVETLMPYAVPLLATILLAFVLVGGTSIYAFNYWVRFGAFGPSGADFPSLGKLISALLVNMIKFFFILIVIALCFLVVELVLGLVGLTPDQAAQQQAVLDADLSAITRIGFFLNVVNLVVVCLVYSFFSANLTQTALASSKEGFEHPHTTDFGIVIFLIYMAMFIPTTLAGLTGSWVLSIGIQVTVGTYIAFSIAVAHGLRYRIATAGAEAPSIEEENASGGDDT